jgi:NAD(P)-dependent dehydrogenase (short-subunit alcohol dehydrogenase family)
VVVTGGGSGIGAAIALRFASEGARVVILDRDAAAAHAVAERAGCSFEQADVSRAQEVSAAFDAIDRALGGLDVLVNNAGVSLRATLLDTSAEQWRDLMATNLDGVFHVAAAAGRRMRSAGRGVILNMGSVSGLVGFPLYGAYCASKAAVIELSRCLALELAPHVRVNSVCPGYVLTPMQRAEYTDQMIEECAAKIPLRRLAAPEEIAALVAFLASDEARFITGQAIVVDGGEAAGGLASG